MERKEVLFIWNLFDSFNYLGVEDIFPYTFSQRNVVEKIDIWFKEKFPIEYSEIKPLFHKRVISGDYSHLETCMREVNKSRSTIRGFQEMPEEMYLNLAKKFCGFAEIEI